LEADSQYRAQFEMTCFVTELDCRLLADGRAKVFAHALTGPYAIR
jgi:hypothetical protein